MRSAASRISNSPSATLEHVLAGAKACGRFGAYLRKRAIWTAAQLLGVGAVVPSRSWLGSRPHPACHYQTPPQEACKSPKQGSKCQHAHSPSAGTRVYMYMEHPRMASFRSSMRAEGRARAGRRRHNLDLQGWTLVGSHTRDPNETNCRESSPFA